MKYTCLDITEHLAKLVPPKIWNDKLYAQRGLNIFERLNLAAPAYILQKQNLAELLNELSAYFEVD